MAYLGNEPSIEVFDESSMENLIINGFFDIWQRGDSQTSEGYGSADRWTLLISNTSAQGEKGYFTSNGDATGSYDSQGVSKNPKYFYRTIVSNTIGTSSVWATLTSRLPVMYDVWDKDIILMFWAKSDSDNQCMIELSDSNQFIFQREISLYSKWTQYKIKISIPDITNVFDSINLNLQLSFFFSSSNIGIIQEGVFDIANVEMINTDADVPVRRKSETEELRDCMRFYETGMLTNALWAGTDDGKGRLAPIKFKIKKMKIPSIITRNLIINDGATGSSPYNMSKKEFRLFITGDSIITNKASIFSVEWVAEAEI